MRIRMEGAADMEAIRAVNELAFGRANEARLVEAVRRSPGFVPELSLVAVDEERIVGHALFSRVTVEAEGETVDVLALGPIAVRPEFQRRGIGGALVRQGLERAAALGFRAVVLIGHPEYYPRFGFRSASLWGLKTAYPVPEEVFLALPLQEGGMDGLSGMVVYPPAFDEV